MRATANSVPISVMRAEPEKGQLHLAVKVVAGKTKALAEATDHIEIRGVYRNGLLGVSRHLDEAAPKSSLYYQRRGVCTRSQL